MKRLKGEEEARSAASRTAAQRHAADVQVCSYERGLRFKGDTKGACAKVEAPQKSEMHIHVSASALSCIRYSTHIYIEKKRCSTTDGRPATLNTGDRHSGGASCFPSRQQTSARAAAVSAPRPRSTRCRVAGGPSAAPSLSRFSAPPAPLPPHRISVPHRPPLSQTPYSPPLTL